MHSPDTVYDTRQEIDGILKKLLGRFFIIFLIAGTLSVTGSLLRAVQFGWMVQQLFHVLVYFGLITGYVLFRKHSPRTLATVLFSITAVDAVVNLWAFGLASTATLMLGYIVIMSATFIGLRAGILAMFLSLVILVIFAAAIITGMLPSRFNAENYLTSWSTWATQITTYIVMTATAIMAASAIKKNLLYSLSRLGERTADLTRTNQDLIESEQKLSTIIRTAPEAIIIASLDGKISSCNERACRLLDFTVCSELSGTDFFSHIPEDYTGAVRSILSNALKQNSNCRDIEYRITTRTGKTVPVKMSAGIINLLSAVGSR